MDTQNNTVNFFNQDAVIPEKPVYKNPVAGISRRILCWTFAGLVILPTLMIWTVIYAGFFGYEVVSTHGTSMEPFLREGDALWVNHRDIHDVMVGDVVTMKSDLLSVTHRITEIMQMGGHDYLIRTKGDANSFSEEWYVNSDGLLPVMVLRVPYAGYLLEAFRSEVTKIILAAIVVVLVGVYLRRKICEK